MAVICSRCKWQVPELFNGICEYCVSTNKTHLHECPDCNEVWNCYGHDCGRSSEYRCPDCFMQLRLLEFND
jgi:hypothetical protein